MAKRIEESVRGANLSSLEIGVAVVLVGLIVLWLLKRLLKWVLLPLLLIVVLVGVARYFSAKK